MTSNKINKFRLGRLSTMPPPRVTVRTRRIVEGTIPVEVLLRLDLGLGFPENTTLWVTVPGGGDWSGERLILGEDAELCYRYEEEVEEDDEFSGAPLR